MAALSTPACSVHVVRNGHPQAAIVVPDNPFPVVTYAAGELQYHLRRASGASLPIVNESAVESGHHALVK